MFALDIVVGQRRIPAALSRFGLTAPPQRLLTTIALALILLALLNALISAAGRQFDARVSHGLQARLRRRVFNHIIGLPIHRIRAHRSGGLAGLLRDDVDSAAGLFATMAYHPWRSLVQLAGTGLALIIVDWRMLVLAVAAFPVLYALHRRWVRRLRPLWRDIGLLRRHSDAHATEAFVGIARDPQLRAPPHGNPAVCARPASPPASGSARRAAESCRGDRVVPGRPGRGRES